MPDAQGMRLALVINKLNRQETDRFFLSLGSSLVSHPIELLPALFLFLFAIEARVRCRACGLITPRVTNMSR